MEKTALAPENMTHLHADLHILYTVALLDMVFEFDWPLCLHAVDTSLGNSDGDFTVTISAVTPLHQ